MLAEDLIAIVGGFLEDLPSESEHTVNVDSAGRLSHRGQVQGYASDLSIEDVITILQGVQTRVIEHDLGRSWPRCPTHGTHPLEITEQGWHCPQSDGTWRFGTLAEQPIPPEPQRADSQVRWMLGSWGVIAHHEGDLWFMYAPGDLLEGQLVTFRAAGRQGRFRRAQDVRPATQEV